MDYEQIENQAIKTFQENLLFLQETDIRLFKKIESLNLAIEKGYYKERYSLEYKEDGYFDVQDVESGKWLYGSDSNDYAKEVAESIDYKKVDNLFETFYNLDFQNIDKNAYKTKDIIKFSYSPVASLIEYSNKYAPKTKTTMKKIYKFIFFGVGLGTHINTVANKINSNVYFIVEDDLELFRLSCFVTNYKDVAKNGAKVFFSVFDEPMEFKNMAQVFLNEQFIYNHYIKFFHILSHSQTKIKNFQNIVATQIHLTFNYGALMSSLLRPLEYLKDGYKILNIATSYEGTPLVEKPLLILGAGPSVDENMDWIRKNHKNFIVVIVSALMSKFEKEGIKPDIITHVHGFKDAMPHIEKVKDMSFFNETISLFGAMSYPDFTKKFKKENVYIFEGSSRYKDDFSGITSSNIGSLAYGLMLHLDVGEIYLLGLDFATNQDTGQTHTSSHSHTRNVKLELDNELGGGVEIKNEIMQIDGNFKDKVYTTVLFDAMRRECNAVAKTYKQHTKCYNLSDGAKIDSADSIKFDKISHFKNIDKKELYKDLRDVFDSRSENFLTNKEKVEIEQKISYYEDVISKLKKHQTMAHVDLNHYHYNLLGLFQDILNDDTKNKDALDMNYIIKLYLEFISGYIFDLINTKEIKKEKQFVKELDSLVIPQMIRVVEFFKDEMKKLYEEIV